MTENFREKTENEERSKKRRERTSLVEINEGGEVETIEGKRRNIKKKEREVKTKGEKGRNIKAKEEKEKSKKKRKKKQRKKRKTILEVETLYFISQTIGRHRFSFLSFIHVPSSEGFKKE